MSTTLDTEWPERNLEGDIISGREFGKKSLCQIYIKKLSRRLKKQHVISENI